MKPSSDSNAAENLKCNLSQVSELLFQLKTLNKSSLKRSGRFIWSLKRSVAAGNQMHAKWGEMRRDAAWAEVHIRCSGNYTLYKASCRCWVHNTRDWTGFKKTKKKKHSDCISKVVFFCLFIDLNKLNKGWGVIVFTLWVLYCNRNCHGGVFWILYQVFLSLWLHFISMPQ